jgi:signal transduction histidine kinase
MMSFVEKYRLPILFLLIIFLVFSLVGVANNPTWSPWIISGSIGSLILLVFSIKPSSPLFPSKNEKNSADIQTTFLLTSLIELNDHPLLVITSDGQVLIQSKGTQGVFARIISKLEDVKNYSTFWSVTNQSLALENGATFDWESNGKVYQTRIQPLHFHQTFFGLFITIQDITSTNKLDQLQTEFLGDLSHELKTPLAAIIGASDILNQTERKLTPKERTMFTEIIKKESNRMQRLMDELSHLTLLDNKLFSTLIKSEFMLHDLLSEVVEVHTLELEKKKLVVSLDESCKTIVFLDRDKAFQIFSNLLSNAIRYTEKGGITVRCDIVQKHTIIHLSDTGAGIEPQNIARVFNRFYRTDFARNRVQGGTGLGLAITRAIIEAHHGKIEVQSVLGKGTTFSITLPNVR